MYIHYFTLFSLHSGKFQLALYKDYLPIGSRICKAFDMTCCTVRMLRDVQYKREACYRSYSAANIYTLW